MLRARAAVTLLALGGLAAAGCAREAIDREALLDPASCGGCHPEHLEEWAGSMHAHASDDAVFVALNTFGQRVTGGAIGDLCVRCHAPVAVAAGLTAGFDLDQVPRAMKGVTCVACHQIEAITALHNGGLTWAEDDVMRGATTGPVATEAHRSAYSPLLDSRELSSSDACGACHDVISPAGVAIESTYAEWASSVFAVPGAGVSCGGCHMPGRDGPAARGGPIRRLHDHRLAGVDLPLIPWPGADAQRDAIERDLAGVLATKLCVRPGGGSVEVDVTLDNVLGGHAFPSGVTHARRAWVELVVRQAGAVTFARGVFASDEPVSDADGTWVMSSRFVGADGQPVDQVWEAAAIESALLAPAVTSDPTDPAYYHAQTRTWVVPGTPDEIDMMVRLEPVGLDILDLLIASGDLDPAVREVMPRLELRGSARRWRRDRDAQCAP